MTNEDLGYDALFEAERQKLNLGDLPVARVIGEQRGAYRVRNNDSERLAKVTGRRMFSAISREDYPAVGDWVAIENVGEDWALIKGILPRRTIIRRTRGKRGETQIIAANIDVAFAVESLDRDFNLNRFERYLALARDGGVEPAILINKADLLSVEALAATVAQVCARFVGVDVITASTVRVAGTDELAAYLERGKTYCFLGSSGVGKSSLINRLLGADILRTGNMSAYSGRGRHITTAREIHLTPSGGIVVDNPGMREVGMTDGNAGIAEAFDDVAALASACRYADCTHAHEPGCAVRAAAASGALDAGRYENYLKLRGEAKFAAMTKFERREKDRRFGKFIKQAKDSLTRHEYDE